MSFVQSTALIHSINRSRGTFGSGKVHWKILSGSDWTYEEALTAHHDVSTRVLLNYAGRCRNFHFQITPRKDLVNQKFFFCDEGSEPSYFCFAAQIVAEQEFLKSEGQVTFEPGQRSANLLIEAISDSVPEYDEDFMLVLFNVSSMYLVIIFCLSFK